MWIKVAQLVFKPVRQRFGIGVLINDVAADSLGWWAIIASLEQLSCPLKYSSFLQQTSDPSLLAFVTHQKLEQLILLVWGHCGPNLCAPSSQPVMSCKHSAIVQAWKAYLESFTLADCPFHSYICHWPTVPFLAEQYEPAAFRGNPGKCTADQKLILRWYFQNCQFYPFLEQFHFCREALTQAAGSKLQGAIGCVKQTKRCVWQKEDKKILKLDEYLD